MVLTYESFNNKIQYPDNFNSLLIRYTNNTPDEYIDVPSERMISISARENNIYMEYLNNWGKYIQNPLKSVHMYVTNKINNDSNFGKNINRVLPKMDSKFGYCKYIDGHGIGDTYWKSNEISKKYFNDNTFYLPYESDNKNFKELCTEWQQKLIDNKIVGEYTYDELITICKNFDGTPFFIWTESPCLIKKIN